MIGTAYARMACGDFRGLASLSDDFELVVSPEVPDAGTYRGEAARLWLRHGSSPSTHSRLRQPSSSKLATTWWSRYARVGGYGGAPAKSRVAGGLFIPSWEATSLTFAPFLTDGRPSQPWGCWSSRCPRRTWRLCGWR